MHSLKDRLVKREVIYWFRVNPEEGDGLIVFPPGLRSQVSGVVWNCMLEWTSCTNNRNHSINVFPLIVLNTCLSWLLPCLLLFEGCLFLGFHSKLIHCCLSEKMEALFWETGKADPDLSGLWVIWLESYFSSWHLLGLSHFLGSEKMWVVVFSEGCLGVTALFSRLGARQRKAAVCASS